MAATKLLSDNGVTSGITGYQLTGGNDGTLQLQTTTTGGTATTAMTIDTSQNVGVGVTPSSWYNAGNLQVGAYAALYTNSSLGSIELTSNTYRSDSSTWNYIAANYASRYQQYDGTHRWYTSTSGTVGGAVSWSESMRISSGGSVGIGTNSPQRKLTVSNGGAQGFEFGAGVGPSSGNETLNYNRNTSAYIPAAYYASTHSFTCGTTGSALSLTMDTSGNVGIGTSSPAYKLDVNYASVSGLFGQTNLSQLNGVRLNGQIANSSTSAIMFQDGGGGGATVGFGRGSGYDTYINFCTNSAAAGGAITERMRIDASGQLGIGGNPQTNLRLSVFGIGTTSSTYSLYCYTNNGFQTFAVRDDGLIQTGTRSLSPYNCTTGSAANMYVGSDSILYRSTSSLKYKTNVQDATHGLTELLALRSVTYEGKAEADAGKTFGGLIAEEVHDAGLTEFVQYADDGTPDALAYGNMVSLCIKAIQEQQALIETLTQRIAALENK